MWSYARDYFFCKDVSIFFLMNNPFLGCCSLAVNACFDVPGL